MQVFQTVFITRLCLSLALMGLVVWVLVHLRLKCFAAAVGATCGAVVVASVAVLLAQLKIEIDNGPQLYETHNHTIKPLRDG